LEENSKNNFQIKSNEKLNWKNRYTYLYFDYITFAT
jgi:hypothetical protein